MIEVGSALLTCVFAVFAEEIWLGAVLINIPNEDEN